MKELVSVIMSTYNEPLELLDMSIQSILSQTYEKIQFIIINDNPERKEMDTYLEKISKKYPDIIVYIRNLNNIGLVKSLNIGLKYATGVYIARMDADDIAFSDRIEKQIMYLKNNSYDMVGASVITIDDNNNEIGEIKVPTKNENIKKFYDYGTCLLHPTWFAKKTVFLELDGYRDIYACEDYDFVVRMIQKGYRIGNVPEFLLKYRIRSSGISVSSEAQQKLTMYYIVKNKKIINDLREEDFFDFLNSKKYHNNLKKMNQYIETKNKIKKCTNKVKKCCMLINIIMNKYLYINLIAIIKKIQRKKYTF